MLTHDVFYNREHSGKDELDSYLPKFWRGIREMEANNTFAGFTLDRMAEDMEQTVRDRFFDSCSEGMLARYEAFLHITSAQETDIGDRRSVLKVKWNGSGKMTGRRIKAIVKELTGENCEVTLGSSRLVIEIPLSDGVDEKIIRDVISRQIPAHIAVDIYFLEERKVFARFGAIWQDDEVFELKEAVL